MKIITKTFMRPIIFISIFILIFCLGSFAQTDNAACPEIKITAPETVSENDGSFKVSASFENDKNPSDFKFNWIIIKNNNLIKRYNEQSIEIETDVETNIEYKITVLAENLNSNCQNTAMASILVIPNVGSPLIIDEYGKLNWNDERAHLDYIVIELRARKDSELFAWIYFAKNSDKAKNKTHLINLLKHFSFRGINKNQITFLISEETESRFRYQIVQKEFSKLYPCDECVIIRGEDLEKITKIF